MVHEFFEIHGPWFFEIQCPKDFCDFGLFNRLAQAGGGGALLYDISLPKTYRPKLLRGKKGRREEWKMAESVFVLNTDSGFYRPQEER